MPASRRHPLCGQRAGGLSGGPPGAGSTGFLPLPPKPGGPCSPGDRAGPSVGLSRRPGRKGPPPLDTGGRLGGLGGGGPRLWPSRALAGPGEGVGASGGEGEAMETGRGLGGAVRDLAGLGEAAEYGGVLPSLPLPLGGPHSGGGGGCAPGCGPGLGVRGCPADDSPRLQGTGVSCRLCGGTDRRHASP